MASHDDSSRQRFYEAATHTLGDNIEQKHVATGLLDEHLELYGDESINEASERLEQSNKRGHKKWRIYSLVILLIGLGIVLYHGWQVNKSRSLLAGLGVLPHSASSSKDPYDDAFKNLNHEQKLLLFGDKRYSGPAAQMKGLWDYEPDNPAYFADYASAYYEEYSSLPPDFIEEGDRLDADNAWFRLVAAGVIAEDAVVKKPTKKPGRRYSRAVGRSKKSGERQTSNSALTKKEEKKILAEYEVVDEVKYQEALDLFYQAAAQPNFDSYVREMLSDRVRLLPQGGDFVTRFVPFIYLAQQRSMCMRYMHISKVVTAEAQRCGRVKDVESLQKLAASWEHLGRGVLDDGTTLVDVLVAKAWITSNLPYFKKAAESCGLEEMKERFDMLETEFQEHKGRCENRDHETEAVEFNAKAGILNSMGAPVIARKIEDTSSVGEMDLKPGRMVDHAFWGRVISGAGWKMFLLICIATFIDSFRGGSVVRKLSVNLSGLLNRVDWMWVLGVGVLAPFAYYLLINEFSPWSARELNLTMTSFIGPAGQIFSLWVILGGLPSLMVRWRLSKAGQMLGISFGKLSVAAVVCAVLAMPAFGLVMPWNNDRDWILYGAWGLLAAAIVLLLVNLCLLFWKKKHSLRRLLCNQCVMPAYVLITLCMALSILLYHAEEKYWADKDEMFKISPEEPGWTTLEYRVSQQVIVEMKLIMGWGD